MNALADDLDHVLEHTASGVWEALRGQQIFLTGGTGFFGRWLLESFAWANARLGLGAHCVVLSRDPAAFVRGAPHLADDAGIFWVTGDVRAFNSSDVLKQLGDRASLEFPFVIHAATESASKINEKSPLTMFDTCVLGTRNVLEFAASSGARRFLFTSSGAVYGPQPSDLTYLPEDYCGGPDPLAVSSAYAEGKRAAEHLCAQWHRLHPKIEPVIARCFAFSGPHLPLDAHFAVGNFLRDALRGGPIRVLGDGTPFRSYLYAADLAVWLWTLLTRAPALRAINVGSMDGRTISEIARTVARIGNSNLNVEIAAVASAGSRPSRYVPETSFARQELGLDSWVDLEHQISRMMTFCRRAGA